MSADKKHLECLICEERYSREDVLAGEYQIETHVCSRCYGRMQRQSYSKSCFGKPTLVDGNFNVIGRGYSTLATECLSICPDRKICRRIITGGTADDEEED